MQVYMMMVLVVAIHLLVLIKVYLVVLKLTMVQNVLIFHGNVMDGLIAQQA
jgi:hypothetical protein